MKKSGLYYKLILTITMTDYTKDRFKKLAGLLKEAHWDYHQEEDWARNKGYSEEALEAMKAADQDLIALVDELQISNGKGANGSLSRLYSVLEAEGRKKHAKKIMKALHALEAVSNLQGLIWNE